MLLIRFSTLSKDFEWGTFFCPHLQKIRSGQHPHFQSMLSEELLPPRPWSEWIYYKNTQCSEALVLRFCALMKIWHLKLYFPLNDSYAHCHCGSTCISSTWLVTFCLSSTHNVRIYSYKQCSSFWASLPLIVAGTTLCWPLGHPFLSLAIFYMLYPFQIERLVVSLFPFYYFLRVYGHSLECKLWLSCDQWQTCIRWAHKRALFFKGTQSGDLDRWYVSSSTSSSWRPYISSFRETGKRSTV